MGTIGDKMDTTHIKLEIKNKQRRLEWILKKLEMSKRSFSDLYEIENADYDLEEPELNKAYKRFIKRLKRDSSTEKTLEWFNNRIVFAENMPECKKLCEQNNVDKLDDIPGDDFPFEELTGFIGDYQLLLKEEKDKKRKEVLKVAAAYALSLGTVWGYTLFLMEPQEYDEYGFGGYERYLFIWEGDIGHHYGSGTGGHYLCEIESFAGRPFYIDYAEHRQVERDFETTLAFRGFEVIDFSDGVLTLQGCRYDTYDCNADPSLHYEIKMQKDEAGRWSVINEKYLGGGMSEEEKKEYEKKLDQGMITKLIDGASRNTSVPISEVSVPVTQNPPLAIT